MALADDFDARVKSSLTKRRNGGWDWIELNEEEATVSDSKSV